MRTGCFMALAWGFLALRGRTTTAGEPGRAVTIVGLFPAAGAVGVCPDTPLRITFSTPPTLGAAGRIKILDAAGGAVVETIDLASPTAIKTIGGLPGFKYTPVIVSGNVVAIFPRNGVLSTNKTYNVT